MRRSSAARQRRSDADLGACRTELVSLLRYGSEEQKQRWLVPQAHGTSPSLGWPNRGRVGLGGDALGRAPEGDVYVLNGQKNWISCATVADHALVFARPTRRPV